MALRLLLADDDEDDCLFFKEALEELTIATHLTTVPDGEQLMRWLTNHIGPYPQVLFLDLNMPRKGGYECLVEIKADHRLRQIPVIILSTSFGKEVADRLYQTGALDCIRKPADFSQLKQFIQRTLSLLIQDHGSASVTEDIVRNGCPIANITMETGKKIRSANLFPVVGIGASAGGLAAFRALLRAIP